jgi:hypothetical protein
MSTNHSRPITIGDKGTKDDPWLDKEIQKIRDQHLKQRQAQRKAEKQPKTPSTERGCHGKANLGRSYAKQADKLAQKHGKTYGVYRCPHCGGTHLTTKLEKADQYPPLLHVSTPNQPPPWTTSTTPKTDANSRA